MAQPTSLARPPKLPAEILEAACRWFVEQSAGELTETERTEFLQWLYRSPEHMQAYLEFAALWEDAPALAVGRAHDTHSLIELARADQSTNLSRLRGESPPPLSRACEGEGPGPGEGDPAPTNSTHALRFGRRRVSRPLGRCHPGRLVVHRAQHLRHRHRRTTQSSPSPTARHSSSTPARACVLILQPRARRRPPRRPGTLPRGEKSRSPVCRLERRHPRARRR